MPSDVVIDGARCLERIRRLYSIWRVSKTIPRRKTKCSFPSIPSRLMMELIVQPMIMMHYILLMLLSSYEDKKKMILLIVKVLLCRFVLHSFLYHLASFLINRHGYSVTKCMMFLLSFVKIQLLSLLVQKKLII